MSSLQYKCKHKFEDDNGTSDLFAHIGVFLRPKAWVWLGEEDKNKAFAEM